MISRFPIFFLVLFSTAVFPWLLLVFKSEQQLVGLQSASVEQETYVYDRTTGLSYDSTEDYVDHVSETGGVVTKAQKHAENAVKEWKLKSNTRTKARQPLLVRKRNTEGDPVKPVWKGGSILAGKRVYQAQGCFQCHTQQVRQQDYGVDIARGWGQRRSVARDYLFDEPVLLGRTRIGPDLANVGTRLDAETLFKHLYRPPHGSNMPSYSYLYNKQEIRGSGSARAVDFEKDEFGAPEEGWEVVPKPSAQDLVAYVLSLRQDYELPEAKFYPVEESHNGGDHGNDTHVSTMNPGIDPKIMAKGKKVFSRSPIGCVLCHQPHGKGLPGVYPPLAGSEWVNHPDDVLVRMVLNGIIGPVKVLGVEYNNPAMQPLTTGVANMSDADIAAVITYIRNEWGNQGPAVSEDTVQRIRGEVGDRATQWTAEELGAYLK